MKTRTTLIEVDARTAEGIDVRLWMTKPPDTVPYMIAVDDNRTGDFFVLGASTRAEAIEKYKHPYAYKVA